MNPSIVVRNQQQALPVSPPVLTRRDLIGLESAAGNSATTIPARRANGTFRAGILTVALNAAGWIESPPASARKTRHASMDEALTRAAERLELRERFGTDAARAESEAMASGRAVGFATAFDYLEAKLLGRRIRRPRARRWRALK
jgi:hypothetical protein